MEEIARIALPFRTRPQIHGTWGNPTASRSSSEPSGLDPEHWRDTARTDMRTCSRSHHLDLSAH